MSRDEEDAATPEKARPSPPAGKMSNPFLQLAQDPTVPTYKQGILARKMHQDADGKKSERLPAASGGGGWGAMGREQGRVCGLRQRMGPPGSFLSGNCELRAM